MIEANLKALLYSDDKSYGRTFNIAYGGQVSIKELWFTTGRLLNCILDSIYRDNWPGDIPCSNTGRSDARRCFKYNPSYSFEDGIELAIEWYKDYL